MRFSSQNLGLLTVLSALCLAVASAWGQFEDPNQPGETPEIRFAEVPPWAAAKPDGSPKYTMPAPVPTGAVFRPGASNAGPQWKILENPESGHLAVIFDPDRQVFAVYHVDARTGEIMLRAVRQLAADFELDHYQTTPAPRELRAMLQERRD